MVYKPGIIIGGRIEHDCGIARSIGYFLEPLVALTPFSKAPTVLVLQGITTDNIDLSVSKTFHILNTALFSVQIHANAFCIFFLT